MIQQQQLNSFINKKLTNNFKSFLIKSKGWVGWNMKGKIKMDKKDILEFQIRMYEQLDTLLPGKIAIIKKYLPNDVEECFFDELEGVINDLKNIAYEYRQFNKDLNAFFGYVESFKKELEEREKKEDESI